MTAPSPLFSEDAETALLASVLMLPSTLTDVRTVITPDAFYRTAHRVVYEAIVALYDRAGAVDPILVANSLVGDPGLTSVGDAHAFLGSLMDAVPTGVNAKYYATIVRDFARKRTLERVLVTALQTLTKPAGPAGSLAPHELARSVFTQLLPFATESDGTGYRSLKDLVLPTMEDIDQRMAGVTGLMTGYPAIDRETHGFRPGELIIIGAAEKLGKSALALNVAIRMAKATPPVGVGYVSAEMMAGTLVERILGSQAQIDMAKIASGDLRSDEFAQLVRWASEIGHYPLWIDDEAEPTLDDVVARATYLKATHPEIGAFVVDFMQLVQMPEKGQTEARELKRIAYGLKGLAKRTKTVIIAPCQINTKEVEDLKDMRPRLKDLQGSSGMRQAADFIALAYREGFYDENAPAADVLELNFAASRRTRRFLARLRWNGPTMTIHSL